MKTMLPVLFFSMLCSPLLSLAGPLPPPDLDFSADTYSGCLTLDVNFNDESFANPGDEIISYTWDFGDGTTLPAGFNNQPFHTYSSPGVYNVTMSVVTTSGWTGSITKNAFISVGGNISVGLGPDQLTCTGDPVNLDATTPNATYTWSTGDHTAVISTLAAGDISVVVNQFGCTAKDTVHITRNAAMAADFSFSSAGGCSPIKTDFTQTSSACSGAIAAYAWDFGDGSVSYVMNPSHDYLSPGSYTVSLTVKKADSTAFTVSKPVAVTGLQTPLIELGPDQVLCDGSALVLNGGNVGDDIIWSTGETTPDITIWDGGLYTVQVTRNGCTAQDSVNITWRPELVANFGFQKTGGCLPVDIQFTDSSTSCASAASGWAWDFGDGNTSTQQNPVHTFTTVGQFPVRLTVTDSTGTTTSKTRKVIVDPSPVSVNLGPDTTICLGESVTLDAANPGATYIWSTGDGTQQINVSDEGTYSVIVDVAGCTARDTVVVQTAASAIPKWGYQVNGNCLPVSVSFSDSSLASCGQALTSWTWDFGDGTTSTDRNPTHLYTSAAAFPVRLTVTSSGGSSASKVKSVPVTNTAFSLSLPASLNMCKGGSVRLDAGVSGAQYAWTPAEGLSAVDIRNPTASPATGGWYTVAVTKCSVTLTDSLLIRLDSAAKPFVSQQANTLKTSDEQTYQWYFDNTLLTDKTSQTIRVNKAGYYAVTVTNSGGCANQSDPYFYIPVSGDEKTSAGVLIKVSPNPAHGAFNILFSQIPAKPVKITVYDASGKKLLVSAAQDHVTRVDMTGYSKALYFVEIINNTQRTILPVVLQ